MESTTGAWGRFRLKSSKVKVVVAFPRTSFPFTEPAKSQETGLVTLSRVRLPVSLKEAAPRRRWDKGGDRILVGLQDVAAQEVVAHGFINLPRVELDGKFAVGQIDRPIRLQCNRAGDGLCCSDGARGEAQAGELLAHAVAGLAPGGDGVDDLACRRRGAPGRLRGGLKRGGCSR